MIIQLYKFWKFVYCKTGGIISWKLTADLNYTIVLKLITQRFQARHGAFIETELQTIMSNHFEQGTGRLNCDAAQDYAEFLR